MEMIGKTMRKIFLLLILMLSLCVTPQVFAAKSELDIVVSLDRDTIGMDEQAVLQIVVLGESQNLPTPNIPTFSMFDI